MSNNLVHKKNPCTQRARNFRVKSDLDSKIRFRQGIHYTWCLDTTFLNGISNHFLGNI